MKHLHKVGSERKSISIHLAFCQLRLDGWRAHGKYRGDDSVSAAPSSDGSSSSVAVTNDNAAVGAGGDDVHSDLDHVRRFLGGVVVNPETVDNESWAYLRCYVRRFMNL